MTRHYHSLVAPSTAVSGDYLSHNRLNPIGRAFLAVDIYTGEKRPVGYTMRQSAWLARANETYVWHAFKRSAQRAEIEAGLIPLVVPARPRANGHGNGNAGHCTALMVPSIDIDDLQLMQIATVVGADRMLAAAVAMEAAE